MNAQLKERLAAEIAVGSIAYVRNLIAAEAAVMRGQFNVAKILRAAAHTQRALAMNAARLLDANQDPVALFETILDELQRGMELDVLIVDEEEMGIIESLGRSIVVRQHLNETVRHSIDSLKRHSDVLESAVQQFLYGCYSCGNIMAGRRPDVCDVCGALETEFESFGPFYSLAPEHLGQRTPDEIQAILAATPGQVARTILNVEEAVLSRKPTPDEWSVKELISHLIETDYLFVWRVNMILSEPDLPDVAYPIPPWKLHEGKGYEEISALELIKRLEDSHAKSLDSVQDLTPVQWCRRGAMLRASRSLVDLGTWVANHDLGHLAQIRQLCQAQ
jgi:rubrerythrin